MESKKSLILELDIDDGKYRFPSTISTAIIDVIPGSIKIGEIR